MVKVFSLLQYSSNKNQREKKKKKRKKQNIIYNIYWRNEMKRNQRKQAIRERKYY